MDSIKVYSRPAVISELKALLAAADSIGAKRNAIVPLDLLRCALRQLEVGGEER